MMPSYISQPEKESETLSREGAMGEIRDREKWFKNVKGG